ncbi:MAG: ABC transporter substrate-binding protein [Verrucomicrobia bacterium]|nr:ABC transporter substrate-binding protein [Verrucomicrobiota bacterium]
MFGFNLSALLPYACRPLVVFSSLALTHLSPAAPVDDARNALVASINEVSTALRERPKQDDLIKLLDTLVDKHFAFETTTRLAIGPAWRDLKPTEQQNLTHLFSRLVIRTYADRVGGDSAPQIVYSAPTELRPGRVEIPTRVTSAGQTYAIAYRLDLDPASNRWRIYDVVAEGVSLIANYRSQFDPIIRKSGASGLIHTLELKLADATAR